MRTRVEPVSLREQRLFATIGLLILLVCSFLLGANAWLPNNGNDKIRGVNLGGLFIAEPWMMMDEWNKMGCGSRNDESSCVKALGQATANAAFQTHWSSWVTQDDINQIKGYGLNTIRVPVGYWMNESLVQSGETFPQGGFSYLESLCQMAKDANLYVILVLHAAPGGQSPNQQFTGKSVSTVQFFQTSNYKRAYQWLEWMTQVVHTNGNFGTVGAIELVNEPVPNDSSEVHSLFYEYYPTAWNRIRAVEDSLQVSSGNRLHIQMMDKRWSQGGGDPTQGLSSIDLSFALYDDHNYRAFDGDNCKPNCYVNPTRRDYMYHSCYEDVGGNSPVIVGEWSLMPDYGETSEFDVTASDAVSWYHNWFGAQLDSYEKQQGWVFWSYKVNWIGGKNDWRWGYQQAVEAGVINSTDPTLAYKPDPCASLSR